MALGETLYVQLVDQSFVPRDAGRRIRSPGKGRIDYAILRHTGGIVAPIERQVFLLVPNSVSELRVAPANEAVNLFAVGIEKKLMVVKSMALFWGIRTVDSVTIQLA